MDRHTIEVMPRAIHIVHTSFAVNEHLAVKVFESEESLPGDTCQHTIGRAESRLNIVTPICNVFQMVNILDDRTRSFKMVA